VLRILVTLFLKVVQFKEIEGTVSKTPEIPSFSIIERALRA